MNEVERIDAGALTMLFRELEYRVQGIEPFAARWDPVSRMWLVGGSAMTDEEALAKLRAISNETYVLPWRCCGLACDTEEHQAVMRVVVGVSHGLCKRCSELFAQQVEEFRISNRTGD